MNHSSYAEIQGIPVAGIGIAGFFALVWLALAKQRGILTIAATAGLAYSLYLAYVEKYILGVWCLYCVISLGTIALITLLGFGWTVAGWVTKKQSASVF